MEGFLKNGGEQVEKKGSHLPPFYFREPFGQVFTNYRSYCVRLPFLPNLIQAF